jgi:hypothetical protein
VSFETIIEDLSTAAGTKWEFKPEGGSWGDIDAPAGGWRKQGHKCDAGTYRAWITIPSDVEGKVVRVAFAAVNFGAEVFAGKDEAGLVKVASHLNAWMPFTADITPFAEPGSKVLLVVEVKGRNKFKRDGKFLVPEGAAWFEGVAEGIIRGVELEILPRVFIDDIFVRTSVTLDTLQAEAVICNATGETVQVTLKSGLSSWNGDPFAYPEIPTFTATLEPGERRPVNLGTVGWGLGRESYWWPNVPYLEGYTAKLHILDLTAEIDGAVVHVASERYGFKEFTTRGSAYFLNGIHCNLRGDNQQEANFGTDAYGTFPGFGAPTDDNAGWPQAVDNLLRANFNVMRIHQIPGTPYMLDICDELGLMIVDESPIRGSEGLEDFVAGKENMVNIDREITLRDRNHPSIVIWSAANETWNERGLMLSCTAAIMAIDDTRPIIADGVPDLGWPIINMNHYVGGLGILPESGGIVRSDRPYGETESVWPEDNTWQGFAWMATSTRIRRLKGNADIRNYVLNNAWSNYVPGQKPELQLLEKKIKDIRWVTEIMDILPPLEDMWNNANLQLLQKSFNPVAVWDIRFDEENKRSNEKGEWPIVKPQLTAGKKETRQLAITNDEFSGEEVKVTWELRLGGKTGDVQGSGEFFVTIPLGEHKKRDITFTLPSTPGDVYLVLRSYKDGQERFFDDLVCFEVIPEPTVSP